MSGQEAFGPSVLKLVSMPDMLAKIDFDIHAYMESQVASQLSRFGKLYTGEVAVKCANECVQIHGGYGFIKDYPAEKFYRDVKLCTIGEGTSEIQKLVIARQLLGKK